MEAFITDTLKFVFPPENHKRVPVEVPLSVSFRSQYMQSGAMTVSPDSVVVYGNADRLQGIEKITTSRIVMTELSESQHGVLRLNAPRGVRLSTDQVSYEIPVSRYVELQATLPVEVRHVPAGRQLQVYPAQARVVLRCAFPLAKDPLGSVKLYVDWRDFSTSLTGRCAPRMASVPSGVLEYRVEPEVFDCVEL